MTKQQMLSVLRRAVDDHKMINDNDKIAVGLSGGKDSIALLTLLKAYQRFSPQKFQLFPIHVDMGLKDIDKNQIEELKKYVEQDLGLTLHIVETNIAEILFEERKEKNPCSLCSKIRRGSLCTKAIELGCNKLALGHHIDDLAETMFLSMFYEGRLSTFSPSSYMSRTDITLIRPIIYQEEKNIVKYAKNMPIVHNPCPANKNTKREYVKQLLNKIQEDIPFVKDRIQGAIIHPERYNLWQPFKNEE